MENLMESFVVQLPEFLVYLAGIIAALVAWRRQPTASLCVLVGLILMAVAELGMMTVGHRLAEEIGYMPILTLRSVAGAAGLGLVVAGACLKPGGARAGVHGSPAWPGQTPPPLAAPGPLYAPQRISKGFYFGWIIGGLGLSFLFVAFLLLIAANGAGSDREIAGILLFPAMLPALVSFVFQLVLLYRLWEAIQDGRAQTTPGAAVGLLFVPFFNLYWIFQAYWGWTQDYNRLRESRGLRMLRPAPEGLAMSFCVFAVLGGLPFVGIVLMLVGMVLGLLFFSSAIDAVNALADAGRATYARAALRAGSAAVDNAAWGADRPASDWTQTAPAEFPRG